MPLTGERKAEAQRVRRARKRLARCPALWGEWSRCVLLEGHTQEHEAEIAGRVRWTVPDQWTMDVDEPDEPGADDVDIRWWTEAPQ